MAITRTLLTHGSDGTATSVNTASISPGANRLIIVDILNSSFGTAGTIALSGCGITWVQTDTVTIDGGGIRQKQFRGMSASPSSGALTISSLTNNGVMWQVHEYDGVDTGGTNGSAAVVQVVSSTTTGDDPNGLTLSLAALGDATNNAVHAAFGVGADSLQTPSSGYTEIYDDDSLSGSNGIGLMSMWKLPGTTSPGASGQPAFADIGGIAIEIKAATSSSAPKTTTGSLSAAIQAAHTATASLSGAVQVARTAAGSLGAAVALRNTSTASLGAAVRAANTASSSLSGAVQASRTVSASTSAAIAARNTSSTNLGSVISLQRTATPSLDSIIRVARSASASLSAALRAAASVNASTSAAIQTSGTVAAGLEAALQAAHTANQSLNAAILLRASTTASVNAYVNDTSVTVVTSSLNAAVQQALSAAANLQAAVQLSRAVSASLDSALQTSGSLSIGLDADIFAGFFATASLDAAVQNASSAAASLDACISDGTAISSIGGWMPSRKTKEQRDKERRELGILPEVEVPVTAAEVRELTHEDRQRAQRAAKKLLERFAPEPTASIAVVALPAPDEQSTIGPVELPEEVQATLIAVQKKRAFEQDLVYIVATLIS